MSSVQLSETTNREPISSTATTASFSLLSVWRWHLWPPARFSSRHPSVRASTIRFGLLVRNSVLLLVRSERAELGWRTVLEERHERAGNFSLHTAERPVCVRYSLRANAPHFAHRRALLRAAACQKCACRYQERAVCAESAGGSERAAGKVSYSPSTRRRYSSRITLPAFRRRCSFARVAPTQQI
jgi:hypothetical protein